MLNNEQINTLTRRRKHAIDNATKALVRHNAGFRREMNEFSHYYSVEIDGPHKGIRLNNDEADTNTTGNKHDKGNIT